MCNCISVPRIATFLGKQLLGSNARFLSLLLGFAGLIGYEVRAQEQASPDLVVHLLNYLAKDYEGAVQNGKIISRAEYDEQVEFASIVAKNTKEVKTLLADGKFTEGVLRLQTLIDAKGPAREVSELARRLQQEAIKLSGIEVAPTTWPKLSSGAKLFQANCISCHGTAGLGDGPVGADLDPKPANFHDPDLVQNSSPYKFYNTIRLGVPGTGMQAFSNLSDEEVWALAFYLKSLPYAQKSIAVQSAIPGGTSIREVATLTDAELAEKLGEAGAKNAANIIGSLRSFSGESSSYDPLQIAENYLSESLKVAASGDYRAAESFALKAYLEGVEPLEPKIRANVAGLVEEIESQMGFYRMSLTEGAPYARLEATKARISEQLREARAAVSEKPASSEVLFWAAFAIFLREGFEAILIIVMLISILRAVGEQRATKWVHVGWVLAVITGVALWFGSGALIALSGLSRELIEGGVSLLAVAILLYVGFWLHRYSETKKWRKFLEAKLTAGLSSGSYLALTLVAFFAVAREALEVVLFLRAIAIDSNSSASGLIAAGTIASTATLVMLSYFAIRSSRRLPLARLFQLCSATMLVLAVVLAGKGAHSLQEAGYLSVSASPIQIRFDLLGLYPSMQTLMAQVIVLLVFACVFVAERSLTRLKRAD